MQKFKSGKRNLTEGNEGNEGRAKGVRNLTGGIVRLETRHLASYEGGWGLML
jgi:hypothetical protein